MISITDMAADKIKEILKAEGVPNHGLRVTAGGSGCCGPSYEIMIDDKAGDGDTVVEKNGAKLFIDASTANVIDGAELGFISDERGEGFVLGFPNGAPAGGSCGCGVDESGSGCGCGGEEPNRGGGCGSGGCGCS
jgi:iron-sulfur cluster assembly accessory protein